MRASASVPCVTPATGNTLLLRRNHYDLAKGFLLDEGFVEINCCVWLDGNMTGISANVQRRLGRKRALFRVN